MDAAAREHASGVKGSVESQPFEPRALLTQVVAAREAAAAAARIACVVEGAVMVPVPLAGCTK